MWGLGLTEWFLLVMVIVIPLVIAVVVTAWSLEQARQRTKGNRPGVVRRRVEWSVGDDARATDSSAEATAPAAMPERSETAAE
jgi:hypothetical protein